MDTEAESLQKAQFLKPMVAPKETEKFLSELKNLQETKKVIPYKKMFFYFFMSFFCVLFLLMLLGLGINYIKTRI